MKASLITLALLALAGCNDLPQARTESEIRRIAADEASGEILRLSERVEDLSTRLADAERENARQDAFSVAISNDLSSLTKTFNGNVQKDNDFLVRQATARGQCGAEWVTYPDGGRAWRNKACTIKDIK